MSCTRTRYQAWPGLMAEATEVYRSKNLNIRILNELESVRAAPNIRPVVGKVIRETIFEDQTLILISRTNKDNEESWEAGQAWKSVGFAKLNVFNIYNFACFCQDRMSNLRERIAKQFLRLKIFKFHFVHFNSLCLRFRWIKQNALILWILYMFARAHYNISTLIKSNLYQHVGIRQNYEPKMKALK